MWIAQERALTLMNQAGCCSASAAFLHGVSEVRAVTGASVRTAAGHSFWDLPSRRETRVSAAFLGEKQQMKSAGEGQGERLCFLRLTVPEAVSKSLFF